MLKKRIQKREAIIGVIGMGYVGIPLTLTFLKADFTLLGFDIDKDKDKRSQPGNKLYQTVSREIVFPVSQKKEVFRNC